jgi:molybdopterin-guanine dinucleotide biosynthesis protein A
VAVVDGRLQPVLGAYHRSLLPLLTAALEGDGAVHRAIAGAGLVAVELAADEVGLNVNTPSDVATADDVIRRRSTWPAGGAG